MKQTGWNSWIFNALWSTQVRQWLKWHGLGDPVSGVDTHRRIGSRENSAQKLFCRLSVDFSAEFDRRIVPTLTQAQSLCNYSWTIRKKSLPSRTHQQHRKVIEIQLKHKQKKKNNKLDFLSVCPVVRQSFYFINQNNSILLYQYLIFCCLLGI